MARFRKKPLEVNAVPVEDLLIARGPEDLPEWVEQVNDQGAGVILTWHGGQVSLRTIQGQLVYPKTGEWILQAIGNPRDIWPIAGDVFEGTYEPPDAEQPEVTESKSTVEMIATVARALEELGTSWRNSWADFDGRTLRTEMEQATGLIDRALKGESVLGEAQALVEEFTFNRDF